jgi:hypothetical protein
MDDLRKSFYAAAITNGRQE